MFEQKKNGWISQIHFFGIESVHPGEWRYRKSFIKKLFNQKPTLARYSFVSTASIGHCTTQTKPHFTLRVLCLTQKPRKVLFQFFGVFFNSKILQFKLFGSETIQTLIILFTIFFFYSIIKIYRIFLYTCQIYV